MVFSLYMRRHHRHDIAPPGKRTKMPLPQKNASKGDMSGITKKGDIHRKRYGIFAEIPH